MSLYTPVFPATRVPPPVRPLSASSSGSSSSGEARALSPSSYGARLSQWHLALAALPSELRPPSPSYVVDEDGVQERRTQIRRAVSVARGEPTSGKWAHISSLVQMGCTRGRWQGVGSRGHYDPPAEGRDWFIADTDEQWFEWEKAQVVKWSAQSIVPPTEAEAHAPAAEAGPSSRGRRADAIKKVEQWQAEVVAEPVLQNGTQTSVHSSDSQIQDGFQRKSKDGSVHDPKQQSPLGYVVVKRLNISASLLKKRKPSVASHQLPSTSRFFRDDKATDRPADGHETEDGPPPVWAIPQVRTPPPLEKPTVATRAVSSASPPPPEPDAAALQRIDEVSEDPILPQTFFPPSFPSELRTSTPPPAIPKTKPPPIPIISVFDIPSPLTSPVSRLDTTPQQAHGRTHSHSHPHPHTHHTTAAASSVIDISSSPSPVTASRSDPALPPSKRKRLDSVTADPPPLGSPPTTPPRSPTLNASDSAVRGTTNGPPAPMSSTPGHRAAPTLTQLLATSKRSKQHTRPLSRPASQLVITPEKSKPPAGAANAKPHRPHLDRRPGHRFSAPISRAIQGHSHPPSRRHSRRPRRCRAGPQPASSGYLGMGYDSQFDVEGNVDRVTELLERDVDFDAWLRDSVEGEQGSQSQS
ncbi:hypothetical protein EWM64_g2424 [Hericium alpestre]|uniref:Uncharacterized protein n=1 Tax=Hericium alpestre TaxID=135208 RepID=A0A4Z0A5S9_9AGAM|nr:hypothetical protein EWM64_g2424 [Hericium alpestre]